MILHLLTLLFVGLKLTGYIDWSWVLVLMPSIISVVFVFLAFMIALIVATKH
jgi:hypothetical protein